MSSSNRNLKAMKCFTCPAILPRVDVHAVLCQCYDCIMAGMRSPAHAHQENNCPPQAQLELGEVNP